MKIQICDLCGHEIGGKRHDETTYIVKLKHQHRWTKDSYDICQDCWDHLTAGINKKLNEEY